jgi:hypothetical protein
MAPAAQATPAKKAEATLAALPASCPKCHFGIATGQTRTATSSSQQVNERKARP